MRCHECKGSISLTNLLREKKCPACGATLRRMPTKEQIRESLISFAEDKGYIFWGLVYIAVVWVVGIFEQIFGSGALYDYVSDHWIRTFFLAAWSGSIIDYYAKANVEVTAVRNKYIFKPPLYLRRFRRWTNTFLILGIALSVYVDVRWPNYISFLPTVTFLTTFCLCLVWAVLGLMVTDDDFKDKRIAYFMQEMRVRRARYYQRASAIYIGGIFVASVVFYWLVHISGLWWYIYNSRLVYNLATFWKNYFAWTEKFAR